MKFNTYIWMTLAAAVTPSAVEPASYSVTFSTYALRAKDTANLYFADAPESLTKLEFRKKSRSDHYQATIQSEDRTLRIYRRDPASAKKTPPILVGRIRIEPTNVPLLLLLTPDGDRTNDRIHAYAIDDSQHNFPQGSIRLVNIAGIDVFGKIGTAQIALEHGGISQAYNQGSRAPLGISIAAKDHNRYYLLYKNNIRITSGSRSLLILTPPTRAGSIRIGGHLLLESPNQINESTHQL